MKDQGKNKRATAPEAPALERTGAATIPWTNLFGDGELPLSDRTHRDGQGLVVILGPVDRLILDLPDRAQARPEQLEAGVAYAEAPE